MATVSYQMSSKVREKAVVERWFFTGFALATLVVAAAGFRGIAAALRPIHFRIAIGD
jgi:hypothetical protein